MGDLINMIWQQGIKEGMGIFFFLFVVILALVACYIRDTLKSYKDMVRSVLETNNSRENRYISTIETLTSSLANVEEVHREVEELRKENDRAHSGTQEMLKVALNRLPPMM